jgi:6-phosphogluconolactonase
MSNNQVVVHATPELVAATAAARLMVRLVDLQNARRVASVVLTGGGTGIGMLEQLRRSPACDAVDWARVNIFWGDERFLPSGHPDRNDTRAHAALLDHVGVDPQRVHPMPADEDEFAGDPEAAAEAYAKVLAAQASPEDHGPVPGFDVCLLGMGEEGHVASVFPSSPSVYESERAVVAVRNCPKPPPTRISLTLPAIRHASEVWLLPTGAAKAAAVAMALSGAGEVALPAAGAVGRRRTLWLLDKASAAKLPRALVSPYI